MKQRWDVLSQLLLTGTFLQLIYYSTFNTMTYNKWIVTAIIISVLNDIFGTQ